jgi:hypothetical protein
MSKRTRSEPFTLPDGRAASVEVPAGVEWRLSVQTSPNQRRTFSGPDLRDLLAAATGQDRNDEAILALAHELEQHANAEFE